MPRWYIWLWKRIGGRPWTFIIRDFYHEVEYAIIVGSFSLGYFARTIIPVTSFWWILGVFTVGFLFGHLFWGTRWVKGERYGNNEKGEKR